MSDRYPDLASSTTRCRTPSCLGGSIPLEVLFNFFLVSFGRRLFMRGHVESLIRHAGRRMTDRSWGTETPEDARAHEERAALVGDVEEVVRRLTERLRGRVSEGGDLHDDALCFQVLHERHEVAVARDQDDHVHALRELHGIDRHANVPVSLALAARELDHVLDAEFDARRL